MKKIISVTLLATILLSVFSAFSVNADTVFPEYGEAKAYGRGNWSADMHYSDIVYSREGMPLLCFSTQGGYLWVVNIVTGEIVDKFSATGSYIYSYFAGTGTDGRFYREYYPANKFEVYDPIDRTFKAVTDTLPMHAQGGGLTTGDGRFLIGEYDATGAKLNIVDEKTFNITKTDTLNEKCQYIKGVEEDENYYYCGMGTGAENTFIIRVDKKTGEKTEFYKDSGGGIIYELTMIGKYLLAKTNGQVGVIDTDTLEVVDTFGAASTDYDVTEEHPAFPNETFYYKSNGLWKYNVETKQHTFIHNLDGLTAKRRLWIELPNSDVGLAFYSTQMKTVSYLNMKTLELVTHELNEIADAGPNIQSFEISEFNVAYVGGYQTSMGAYNIDTGDFLYSIPSWHQNEGVGFVNGQTIFGTYTDAVLFSYDPEKPLNYRAYNYDTKIRPANHNPRMIYDIEDKQDRPFVVKGYRGKVYTGTMAGYNELGGALTITSFDENGDPDSVVLRHIVKDQSITGIAFKDNLCYISGTVRGGLGITPSETEAKITVMNIDTNEIVQSEIKPYLPEIGTSSLTIGEISIGPDGLLWGCSEKEGMVFALDPETFECVKYVSTNPGDNRGALARPLYLRWGDDGLLYTTAGWNVCVIDPETMDYHKITGNCSLATLDVNGNVWFAKGSGFQRVLINQYDRLKRFLGTLEKLSKSDYTADEWNTLQEEIKVAKSYTEETEDTVICEQITKIKHLRDKTEPVVYENEIDIIFNGEKLELNKETGYSKVYNGRTLLPYKKFFELIGFNSGWNVHTSTITASNADNEIKIKMNENKFTLNNEECEMDSAFVLLSHRHYIPVRPILEKLGYTVSWDSENNSVVIEK